MSTPLAFFNLTHGKWQTCVSTCGVALAIILMFMQLGFLWAICVTAVQIYDQLDFDVLVRSPDYYHLCDARDFPREYLMHVASQPEVDSARPMYVTVTYWRIPRAPWNRETEGEVRWILVLALEPELDGFPLSTVSGDQVVKLRRAEYLLIDRKSKARDYGAFDGLVFGEQDEGRDVEIGQKRFQIAGHYTLGAGFAANGSVLMSPAGFARFYPRDVQDRVHLGLIKLLPGVDPDEFCARIRHRLVEDGQRFGDREGMTGAVAVLTRSEVRRLERNHWLWGTPSGAIFMIGVLVALVVGSVVVYMVLSNDVAKQIREYATLKAMGYSHRYLSGVVMQQALILALMAYGVSWCVAELLYWLVSRWANIPMEMNWSIRGLVLFLSICMCCVSGLATVRRLRTADPADLF